MKYGVLVGFDRDKKKMYTVSEDALQIVDVENIVRDNFEIITIQEFIQKIGHEKQLNIFYVMKCEEYRMDSFAGNLLTKLYDMYNQDSGNSELFKIDGLNSRICRLAFKLKSKHNVL